MVLLLLFGSSFLYQRSRPRLRLLFLPLALPTSLATVGDLGQELSDVLDFRFFPDMDRAFPVLDALRSRNLADSDMVGERLMTDTKLFGGFARGVPCHKITQLS